MYAGQSSDLENTAVTLLARCAGVSVEGLEALIVLLGARAKGGHAALVGEHHTVGDEDEAVGALEGADDLGIRVGGAHEALAGVNGDKHASLLGGAVGVQAQGVVAAAVAAGALGVGGHVVLEDVGELGDVLEQGVHGAGGELLERIVSGGEHGQLAAREGAGEAGSLKGSGQGGVGGRAGDGVGDVLAGLDILGRSRDHGLVTGGASKADGGHAAHGGHEGLREHGRKKGEEHGLDIISAQNELLSMISSC